MSPSNPHRRLALSVLAATLLGALTTITIAWGFAVGVNTILHQTALTFRRTPGAAWAVQEHTTQGAHSLTWSLVDWATRTGISASEFDAIDNKVLFGSGVAITQSPPRIFRPSEMFHSSITSTVIEHTRGWPIVALGCATRVTESGGRVMHVWGIEFHQESSWSVDLTHLPLYPLFPGFYIDTALYASLWWAALFFRPFRRSRRIARGLCPACAYSLKGLPPDATKCPECGGLAVSGGS